MHSALLAHYKTTSTVQNKEAKKNSEHLGLQYIHNGVKSNLIQFLQILNPLHFVSIFSMFDLKLKNLGVLNSTVDGRGKISNTFLLIFPSFLCLLSTKLLAKWSRVPSQLSWGKQLSTKVNFDIFSSFQLSKIPQIFKYFCSCAFLRISANLNFIAINLHWFKGPPVQFWSSCCICFYLFLGYPI